MADPVWLRRQAPSEVGSGAERVVDGNLVTSRNPDDIPAFNRAMIELFAQSLVGNSR